MAKHLNLPWHAALWAGLFCLAALARGQPEGNRYAGLDFMPPTHASIVAEKMPDADVLAGGIRFRETRSGEGPVIRKGDVVEAIYTGRLLDGTIFNQKTGRWHTFTFEVGAEPRQIIQGWEMAMPLMQMGGAYEVAIPAQFAYRDKGRPGQVPPYATVLFDIEILDVRPRG